MNFPYYNFSFTKIIKILVLMSDSTKTIQLPPIDFYEVIVYSGELGFAPINYPLIKNSSSE